MAIENIDTVKLKNALNACLNDLDTSKTSSLITTYSSNIFWQGKSKDKFVSALTKLKDTKYKNLKDKIQYYLSYIDDIEQYQEYSKSLEDLSYQKREITRGGSMSNSSKKIVNNDNSKEIEQKISDFEVKMDRLKTKLDNM